MDVSGEMTFDPRPFLFHRVPEFLFEEEAIGIEGSGGSNIVYVDGGYVRGNANAVAKSFLVVEKCAIGSRDGVADGEQVFLELFIPEPGRFDRAIHGLFNSENHCAIW